MKSKATIHSLPLFFHLIYLAQVLQKFFSSSNKSPNHIIEKIDETYDPTNSRYISTAHPDDEDFDDIEQFDLEVWSLDLDMGLHMAGIAPKDILPPTEYYQHRLVITPHRNADGGINYEIHLYNQDGREVEIEYHIDVEDSRDGERQVLVLNPPGLFAYTPIMGNNIRIDLGQAALEAGDLFQLEFALLIEEQNGTDPRLRIRQGDITLIDSEDEEDDDDCPRSNPFAALLDDSDSEDEDEDEDDTEEEQVCLVAKEIQVEVIGRSPTEEITE